MNIETMIKALRILAQDIQSSDGVANACVADAADMIERLSAENEALEKTLYILITDILWHHNKTAFVPLSLAKKAIEIKERFFKAAGG